jgi:hypothetical protein
VYRSQAVITPPASQLQVLDPLVAGQDVEGDIQDMIGFMVGTVPLQELEVVVDFADQNGERAQSFRILDGPQPLGEFDRFTDPDAFLVLPVFQLGDLCILTKLAQTKGVELRVGDHSGSMYQ